MKAMAADATTAAAEQRLAALTRTGSAQGMLPRSAATADRMLADRTLRLDVPRQGMLLRMVGLRMPQLLTRAAADTLVVAADMPAVVVDIGNH